MPTWTWWKPARRIAAAWLRDVKARTCAKHCAPSLLILSGQSQRKNSIGKHVSENSTRSALYRAVVAATSWSTASALRVSIGVGLLRAEGTGAEIASDRGRQDDGGSRRSSRMGEELIVVGWSAGKRCGWNVNEHAVWRQIARQQGESLFTGPGNQIIDEVIRIKVGSASAAMHGGAAKDHANRRKTPLQLSGGQKGGVDLIEATGKADQVRILPRSEATRSRMKPPMVVRTVASVAAVNSSLSRR